jgi:cell division septation protein DedD
MVYRDIYYPGGSEWYEIFNVKDQLASVFDYFGKMSDSFFASADTKMTMVAKAKPENKKSEEKLIAKKETANITEKKKTTKTNSANKEITKSKGNIEPETLNLEQKSSEGNIYIIVGSFKVESNATRLTSNLVAKGYTATTFKNKNGMTYAAVGGFKSVEIATDTMQQIKSKEGMDAWIYKM